MPWLSLVFMGSRKCTSGATKAELNPTSQTELDHFLYGSGIFRFCGRGTIWFCLQLCKCVCHFLRDGREGLKV